eukprot:m.37320 g.37320  ORF g.37320 m.37320 type:complete len:1154 (+) comp5438_c0_seq2:78-3539(+)
MAASAPDPSAKKERRRLQYREKMADPVKREARNAWHRAYRLRVRERALEEMRAEAIAEMEMEDAAEAAEEAKAAEVARQELTHRPQRKNVRQRQQHAGFEVDLHHDAAFEFDEPEPSFASVEDAATDTHALSTMIIGGADGEEGDDDGEGERDQGGELDWSEDDWGSDWTDVEDDVPRPDSPDGPDGPDRQETSHRSEEGRWQSARPQLARQYLRSAGILMLSTERPCQACNKAEAVIYCSDCDRPLCFSCDNCGHGSGTAVLHSRYALLSNGQPPVPLPPLETVGINGNGDRCIVPIEVARPVPRGPVACNQIGCNGQMAPSMIMFNRKVTITYVDVKGSFELHHVPYKCTACGADEVKDRASGALSYMTDSTFPANCERVPTRVFSFAVLELARLLRSHLPRASLDGVLRALNDMNQARVQARAAWSDDDPVLPLKKGQKRTGKTETDVSKQVFKRVTQEYNRLRANMGAYVENKRPFVCRACCTDKGMLGSHMDGCQKIPLVRNKGRKGLDEKESYYYDAGHQTLFAKDSDVRDFDEQVRMHAKTVGKSAAASAADTGSEGFVCGNSTLKVAQQEPTGLESKLYVTGAVVDICRHYTIQLAVNMLQGEKYSIYNFCERVLSDRYGGLLVTAIDVACRYVAYADHADLFEANLFEETSGKALNPSPIRLVGELHSQVHGLQCKFSHGLAYSEVAGRLNGEEAERVFSILGTTGLWTKLMTHGGRMDALTEFAQAYNERKASKLVEHLWQRFHAALVQRGPSWAALVQALGTAGIPRDSVDLVDTDMIAKLKLNVIKPAVGIHDKETHSRSVQTCQEVLRLSLLRRKAASLKMYLLTDTEAILCKEEPQLNEALAFFNAPSPTNPSSLLNLVEGRCAALAKEYATALNAARVMLGGNLDDGSVYIGCLRRIAEEEIPLLKSQIDLLYQHVHLLCARMNAIGARGVNTKFYGRLKSSLAKAKAQTKAVRSRFNNLWVALQRDVKSCLDPMAATVAPWWSSGEANPSEGGIDRVTPQQPDTADALRTPVEVLQRLMHQPLPLQRDVLEKFYSYRRTEKELSYLQLEISAVVAQLEREYQELCALVAGDAGCSAALDRNTSKKYFWVPDAAAQAPDALYIAGCNRLRMDQMQLLRAQHVVARLCQDGMLQYETLN